MQVTIDHTNIDYLDIGNPRSVQTIVFLHGWHNLANKEIYLELLKLLSDKFRVIAIDFPGFGKSPEPLQAWTVSDYARLVEKFIDHLKIKKCILIGHSFGGRVATKIAAKNPKNVEKLILIASAGVEKKALNIRFLAFTAGITPQFIKKIFSEYVGSVDYKKTTGIMRQTFKNVINEDLQHLFPQIKIPVLLVWGQLDNTTPLAHAKIMHQLLPDSKLKIIPEGNHGIPYRHAQKVAQIILKEI